MTGAPLNKVEHVELNRLRLVLRRDKKKQKNIFVHILQPVYIQYMTHSHV